jgi:hypothetical protein
MSSCIFIVTEPQVQPELQELERYVYDALGATVKTAPWRGTGNLPPVLRERYKFAQAELLGLRALLVIDSNPEEQPPATVRKHMDMLQARQRADPIYVRAQVTAYNRNRLIEQKVPFIVPGNQMYLPMLAIDWREHFRRVREESSTFSPSTQVAVLHALLREAGQVLIPAEMAPRLGELSAFHWRPKRDMGEGSALSPQPGEQAAFYPPRLRLGRRYASWTHSIGAIQYAGAARVHGLCAEP